ncbi:MAG: class I SAM-dependent methyltransferase [Phycisphaerae bacterium]|nr:class I SAM-dependent methyltransferase [Phycisphaerae bacterium]
MTVEKKQVFEFWNQASCGEDLYLANTERQGYEEQARHRYALEPYIFDLAKFHEAKGKRVLEIGVGLGADHQQFAQAGAVLSGVDLTDRAIEHTKRRLAAFGLQSTLAVGDAENLAFADGTFDIVYSWGVLHHTPNTPKAIAEVWRILKPGGVARIMIYSKWSMIGVMLWIRYALLRLRPWMTLTEIYSKYLESPGTKAYTVAQAHQLMSAYENVRIWTVLTHGDLLESMAGQRHSGRLISIARRIWPRWLIKRLFPRAGLFMLIEGRKPA